MLNLQKNIETLEGTQKTLHNVLSRVGKALTSAENFDYLINLILETTVEALGAEKGVIVYLNEKGNFEIKSLTGFDAVAEKPISNSIDSYLVFVTKERKPISIPYMDKETDKKGLFAPPLVCIPFIFRDKVWGAICLSGKKMGGNFNDDEIRIISNLSSQIAVAFENDKLNGDIERTYFETMSALALAVEARDVYSRGHSEKVGIYAAKIGRSLGLSEKDIETLRDSSKLHDVGKIGIVDEILKKPANLSDEQKEIMKKHPIMGESIVRPLKNFQHLLEPIRHHHEFLDGSGYPDGLKGAEISLITRILTVADIYEALTSNRPYRESIGSGEAKKELKTLAEQGKIDTKAVDALVSLIDRGGING